MNFIYKAVVVTKFILWTNKEGYLMRKLLRQIFLHLSKKTAHVKLSGVVTEENREYAFPANEVEQSNYEVVSDEIKGSSINKPKYRKPLLQPNSF